MFKATNVGVDIGEYSVKCAVLEKNNGIYYITRKKKYIIPKRGQKFDFFGWLKSVLSDFTKTNRIGKAVFCFSLSYAPPDMIIRMFDMPKLSDKEIEKGMKFEIEEKTLVEDINTVFYKWDKIRETPDNYSIFMAIVQREIVRSLKKLASVKWKIEVIEPHIISLGRLVSGNSVVLDFAHSGTNFIAYKKGKPFHVQMIDMGGKHFTQKIANEYGDFFTPDPEIRYQEAENIKHEKGMILNGIEELEDNPISIKVARLLREPAELLAREIKQVIRVLEIQNEFTIDNVYYVGEGARLKYLTSYISREIGYELRPLAFNYDSELPESITDEQVKEILDDYPYMAASGVSLYKDFRYFEDLNLADIKLPVKVDYKAVFAGIMCFTLLSQIALFDLHRRVDKVLEEITVAAADKQKEVESFEGKINNEQNRINSFYQLQSLAKTINDVANYNGVFTQVLTALADNVPAGVAIEHLIIQDRSVLIKGYADSYRSIGYFALTMQKYGSVNIDVIENEIDLGGREFLIPLEEEAEGEVIKMTKAFDLRISVSGAIGQ